MSTEFYRLKLPFTSARATVEGGHTRLALWVNHAKAGEIVLRNEEVPDVLQVLRREQYAVHRYETGDGKIGFTFGDDVESCTTLISEYGELTTLEEINPELKSEAS